ncbi:MAG: hypothetical protein ACTHJW_09405 [Streptosporangiaceae bacterium]
MSDRRDPIETWLSADVELMPPPPGAFERVHRRARHRRAMKALTTAAGAAVIIAAGVTVPQLASALHNGRQAPPAKIALSRDPTPMPAGGPSALPGPALSMAGYGPGPAARFRPSSVTFVGPTLGAVLGIAGTCGPGPCTAMAGTKDYGTTWTEIGAPPAGRPDGATGVSQVRFLNRRNGWAYGPALYATHDGGESWHAINTKGRRVIDLSTVGHRAFAVLASGCTGTGEQFGSGCTAFRLFSTPASADRWQSVPDVAGAGLAVPGGLQLTGRGGYLFAGGRLYAGPVTAGSWHRVRATPSTPGCLNGRSPYGVRLIAPTFDARALYLTCGSTRAAANLSFYVSTSNGQTWRSLPRIPVPADAATSLAVSPAGPLILASRTGLFYSKDGRVWRQAKGPVPAGGFSFAGMTTSTNGVAVAEAPVQAVYITTDGGLTWRARSIR